MMEFTTIEKLQMKVSATYGSVLKFGDHAEQTFADNGHAIAWCMSQVAK